MNFNSMDINQTNISHATDDHQLDVFGPEECVKRISIAISKNMHRAIKMKALEMDQTMREYIITIIANELKN
jgi:hypothetical protein